MISFHPYLQISSLCVFWGCYGSNIFHYNFLHVAQDSTACYHANRQLKAEQMISLFTTSKVIRTLAEGYSEQMTVW